MKVLTFPVEQQVERKHVRALREAAADGAKVRILTSGDRPEIRGHVDHVAPSGAYAKVGGWHVPLHVVTHVERTLKTLDSDTIQGNRPLGATTGGSA